jgi:hypothetical protein
LTFFDRVGPVEPDLRAGRLLGEASVQGDQC